MTTLIQKDFIVKNGIIVQGSLVATSSTAQTGTLQISGGAAIAKNLVVGSTSTLFGPLYAYNDFEVTGRSILGDTLFVLGTQTTINSTLTSIAAPVIDLGTGENFDTLLADDLLNKGILLHYFTSQEQHMFFGRNNTTGRFEIRTDVDGSNHVVPNENLTSTGILATLDIGSIIINDDTASSNTSTGALVVGGGIGVGGDIYLDVANKLYGTATQADNLNLGGPGEIAIQSAAGTTAFIAPGTIDGTVLTWDSSNSTATWSSIANTTVNNANTATNLAGGAQHDIPVQYDTGKTTFDSGVFTYNTLTKILTVERLLVNTGTNNVAGTYGHDLDIEKEALSIRGALRTIGNAAIGGVLYAGMNDDGDIADENPHNKTIEGVFIANNMQAGGTYDGISTTATVTIDLWDKDLYTTVKYLVQVKDSTSIHSQEIMVIHNGTTVYMTEYGVTTTAGELGIFDAIITGTDIALTFAPVAATNMTVNVVRQSIISGLQGYGP
jgi:hypothetical protein